MQGTYEVGQRVVNRFTHDAAEVTAMYSHDGKPMYEVRYDGTGNVMAGRASAFTPEDTAQIVVGFAAQALDHLDNMVMRVRDMHAAGILGGWDTESITNALRRAADDIRQRATTNYSDTLAK